jgi:hypothetical protein
MLNILEFNDDYNQSLIFKYYCSQVLTNTLSLLEGQFSSYSSSLRTSSHVPFILILAECYSMQFRPVAQSMLQVVVLSLCIVLVGSSQIAVTSHNSDI